MIRPFLATCLCLLFLIAGCGPVKPSFNAVDITGVQGYGADFHLVDHNGKTRTMEDFRGKVVAIFFGYTHCPDVCPTTLSDMKRVMEILGKDGERLQVLFVTLDPARDTPALLSQYVPSFNSFFLGLTGDEIAVAQAAKNFKIVSRKVAGKAADSYSVDHTAGTLVFDPQSRLRLYVNYGLAPEKIAADIKRLL